MRVIFASYAQQVRVNIVPESASDLQMTRTGQMRIICVRVRVIYLRPIECTICDCQSLTAATQMASSLVCSICQLPSPAKSQTNPNPGQQIPTNPLQESWDFFCSPRYSTLPLPIRMYRFSSKLELDFSAFWADVGWYGDPTKQFSNLKTHKRESASHF